MCRTDGVANPIATTAARGHEREEERAPPPDERARDERAHDQRREARLRERDEQARPDHARGDDDRDQGLQLPLVEDDDDAREDRDDEEAPVHRRVVEDRVDAEERRVRVRDAHAGVPEDVAREPLVQADHREDERHREQLAEEQQHVVPRPRRARERDREQAERQHEEEQLDRALAAGPASRGATARARRRAAPSGQASGPSSRTRPVVPVQPPRERERGRDDDEVERHEQVRLRRPDRHGDPRRSAREHEHGQQPRPAERAAPRAARRRPRRRRPPPRRRRGARPARARPRAPRSRRPTPRARPAATAATARGSSSDQAERADHAAGARPECSVARRRTTTSAFAACPLAGDVEPVDAGLLRRLEAQGRVPARADAQRPRPRAKRQLTCARR